ncbi:WD40 repeat domain-containing protein [Streptomyces sp. NPDC046866]|uniref:WD40 repeat domain-containing protein n=1 Tax=Streptomyces sp. NPDC046866 TaxID=3154921 RepID=UPI003452B3A7
MAFGPALTGRDGPLLDVAFSPDGRSLAACGESDTVVLYRQGPNVGARRPRSLAERSPAAALGEGHCCPAGPVLRPRHPAAQAGLLAGRRAPVRAHRYGAGVGGKQARPR